MYEHINETVEYLVRAANPQAKIGIVLDYGTCDLVEKMDEKIEVDYMDIPNFSMLTVPEHRGDVVFGKLGDVEIIVIQSNFHLYEGYSAQEVVYPIYVMKQLGIEKLILGNCSTGVNEKFEEGTLMIIEDHINFMGTDPLIGCNDEKFALKFPDTGEVYKKEFIDIARKCADDLGLKYEQGVYLGVAGPSRQTPAELNAFSILGADSVGVSIVPEAIVANYLGMGVLGMSCNAHQVTVDGTFKADAERSSYSAESFCELIVSIVEKLCQF